MKKRSRIVLDRYIPPIKTWNWRDDWYTKHDSAYSLFAKFAYLNAFAARDLVNIFIDADSGKRTKILRNPQVDLRDPSLFDITAMSVILRADVDEITQSFLYALLPNSRRKSVDYLRWCKHCAATGFHSPLFQLEIIHQCPLHGIPLLTRCPQCKERIPYRLSAVVTEVPFACSFCKTDLAPVLRKPKTQSLKLMPEARACLQNVTDLLKLEDQMIPMKLEFNRSCKSQGKGEIVIAPVDVKQHHLQYIGFVVQVLDEIKSQWDTAQPPLGLAPIIEMVHGERKEVRAELRASRKTQYRIKKNTSAPINRETDWGDMLKALYEVYAAIRRDIWRHIVKEHQACITSAGKRLWWHMEGEKTPSFCPIAEAFLRWRMFWEGCGVPQHLIAPMQKPPLGILGWQAQYAPICPAGWTRASEIWVATHIFAQFCRASFHDWITVAMQNHAEGHIHWARHATNERHTAYWALSGHDSWEIPVRVYLQTGAPLGRASLPLFSQDGHHETHLIQLSKLKR